MRTAVFSTKSYDRTFLDGANPEGSHELVYFEARLVPETAPLAAGCEAVCAFVNDQLDRAVLTELYGSGTRVIALRAAGFNNVDLVAAGEARDHRDPGSGVLSACRRRACAPR